MFIIQFLWLFIINILIFIIIYIVYYYSLCIHIYWLFMFLNGQRRLLRAIFNKSWRQHPTKHQLYGHQPPITKTIKTRRTRHARHCWRSRDELISDFLLWTPSNGRAKAGRPARTYIKGSYVRIRDVALRTYQKRWTIGRSDERRSGISVLAVRHGDDNIHFDYLLFMSL